MRETVTFLEVERTVASLAPCPKTNPSHPMPSHHPSSLSIFLLRFPGAPSEFKGHAGSIRWGVSIVEAQGPLEGQQGAVMLKRISRDRG